LISVIVDVDDTIIDTQRRIQAIWSHLLGGKIPLQAVQKLNTQQIFAKYASSNQKARVNELRKRFWDILLCSEKVGIKLVKLDEPIPYAADILQKWSKNCKLVYLTGRPETNRDLTLEQLKKFGFPIDNTQLVMYDLEDYACAKGASAGPTLAEARLRLLTEMSKQHKFARVVDDYPGYFTLYRQFNIPDRIGLLRSEKFSTQNYIDEGATKVVESWKQLEDDLPRPI
jgi:hypothetical protein